MVDELWQPESSKLTTANIYHPEPLVYVNRYNAITQYSSDTSTNTEYFLSNYVSFSDLGTQF